MWYPEGISKECGKGGELNTSCLKLAVLTEFSFL
jgi:hypothetical protein